ncbi:MAG: hypothetical protein ACK55I_46280, partial [bacterium]
ALPHAPRAGRPSRPCEPPPAPQRPCGLQCQEQRRLAAASAARVEEGRDADHQKRQVGDRHDQQRRRGAAPGGRTGQRRRRGLLGGRVADHRAPAGGHAQQQ